MKKKSERFRLRNMNVTRVDMVDRGANQLADIVLAKADTEVAKDSKKGYPDKKNSNGKKRPEGTGERGSVKVKGELAERIREAIARQENGEGGEEKKAEGKDDKKFDRSPLSRPRGEQQRIVRIRPTDFEVTSADGNMMEWAIPEDKLPESVEEAIMTMAQSGEGVMFQWMIDPLAGPPVEGTAKTAEEAFLAMRGALTNTGSMDPSQMLGGFPNVPGQQNGQQPGQNPQQQQAQQQPKPERKPSNSVAKRVRTRKRIAKSLTSTTNPDETLDDVLDIITKGLVDVNVFAETATGEDLGDILPEDSLEKLTSKLSARRAPSNQ